MTTVGRHALARPALTRRQFTVGLLLLFLAGTAGRLILVALTPGEYYDTSAMALVGDAFLHAPLHVYDLNIHSGSYQASPTYLWPYPPAFLPIAGALRWLAYHTGETVSHLDRLLIVVADLAIAWLVLWAMGRMGRSDRQRLQGVALVALGPVFIAVSAVHGQIDALAWLPGIAAVAIWERGRDGKRALVCGALVGLGIAIKTTPGLILLALAPTARDRREIVHLVIAAALVMAVTVLPFALASPDGLRALIHYRGFPGRAGLTVLLQPRLALLALTGTYVTYDATTGFLLDHSTIILAVGLIPVAVIVWIRQLPAALATVALLLAFYVAGPALLPQYWLWIVPFMILANRIRTAVTYQIALLPLLVMTYAFIPEPGQPHRRLSSDVVLYGYVPWLWIVSVGLLVALIVLLTTSSGERGIRTLGRG